MAIFFDLGQIMKKVTTIPPIAKKKPHKHIQLKLIERTNTHKDHDV
jgi:hypothetical protein